MNIARMPHSPKANIALQRRPWVSPIPANRGRWQRLLSGLMLLGGLGVGSFLSYTNAAGANAATSTAPEDLAHLLPPAATLTKQQRFAQHLFMQPTLITLHLTHASPAQVCQALCTQVGLKYKFEPMPFGPQPAPMNFNVEKVPFFTALRKLLTKSGYSLNPYNHVLDITAMGGTVLAGPHDQTGRFLIVASTTDDHAKLTFTGDKPQQTNRLTLQIDLFSEPMLRGIIVGPHAVLTLAMDNRGNNLLVPESHKAQPPDIYNAGAYWYHNLTFYLRRPVNLGTQIARIHGTISIGARTASKNIAIDHIMQPKLRIIYVLGNKLILKPIAAHGNTYAMRVQVAPPGVNPAHLNDTSTQKIATAEDLIFTRPLPVLTDAAGHHYQCDWQPDCGCQQDGKGTLSFAPPSPAGTQAIQAGIDTASSKPAKQSTPENFTRPIKFLWQSPAQFTNVLVHFTLKNLKLPQ
ncbi:MAG: hypothetical protein HKL96_06835 [Phycisphaerales bacterium]|nr:hypothetical protein [Phycisphaerales bacterium]